MKFRIEISDDTEEDEIIIRCKSKTEKVRLIENAVESILEERSELVLYIKDTEYYIPKRNILFFETDCGKVKAHTDDRIYTADYKLFELEKIMPPAFIRVSKSCILNAAMVEGINKNLTGASEVYFRNSSKKVYVSRAYYKLLKEKINEMRF